MVYIKQVPEQQSEVDELLALPEPKQAWHDVPQNRWIIRTGDDIQEPLE